MKDTKESLSNMSLDIKTEEVVKKQVATDGHILKEAIAHTLEEYGYYHYACEPTLDVDDYGDNVSIELNRESVKVDDFIDDHFVIALVKKVVELKNKENSNE